MAQNDIMRRSLFISILLLQLPQSFEKLIPKFNKAPTSWQISRQIALQELNGVILLLLVLFQPSIWSTIIFQTFYIYSWWYFQKFPSCLSMYSVQGVIFNMEYKFFHFVPQDTEYWQGWQVVWPVTWWVQIK